MTRGSLRRYDVQAVYSLRLACVSWLPLIAAAGLVLRNYNAAIQRIEYANPLWLGALLGCTGLAMLGGGLALALGFNSAGQRRNDKPRFSWIGFFLGGTVLSLAIVVFLAVYMLRLQVAQTP